MTLVAQTIWGAIFTKIGGFSFLVLRFSTIVLAVLFTYFFNGFITNRRNPRVALFATLSLILGPIFIAQSVTFMTEIPYLITFFLAIVHYYKFFDTQKGKYLVYGILFSVIALMIRQTALILPLGFGVTHFLLTSKKWKNIIQAALPTVIAIIVLIGYKNWRIYTNNIEGSYSNVGVMLDTLLSFDVDYLTQRIGVIILHVGFFLSPISIFFLVNSKQLLKKTNKWKYFILTVVLIPFIYSSWNSFPIGNVMYNLGLGPKVLKEVMFYLNRPYSAPEFIWNGLRILATISIFILGMKAINKWSNFKKIVPDLSSPSIKPNFFLITLGSGLFIFLVLNPTFFDRYLLPITMLLTLFIALNSSFTGKLTLPYALTIGIGLISIVLSRDYFSWSRTRAEALNYLTQEMGVSPSSIDGGVEFNGWHKSGPWRDVPKEPDEKSWWFVTDDEYLISTGPFPKYKKLKSFNYQQILPYRTDTIFILKMSILKE